jgi:hypothetical protein
MNKRLKVIAFLIVIIIGILTAGSKLNMQKENDKELNDPHKRAQLSIEKCSGNSHWEKCYAKEMENIAYFQGSKYAHRVLYEIQEIDHAIRGGCHFIAHGIGWGVYKKNPSEALSSIAESSSTCSWGEQMGIVEKYVANIPGGKLRDEDVKKICEPNPGVECNHALGHMLLVETRDDVDAALEMCSVLKDTIQQAVCYSGVYMERIIGSNLFEHGISEGYRDWKVRFPEHEALCRNYSDPLLSASCWRVLSIPAQYYFQMDPKRVLEFCNTAPSREASWSCKMHLIAEIGPTLKVGNDLSKMKAFCELDRSNEPEFEQECYKYLVIIKLNSSSLEQAKDTVNFCNSLTAAYQRSCFWGIGHGLVESKAAKRDIAGFCEKAPKQYETLCRGEVPGQEDTAILHDMILPVE